MTEREIADWEREIKHAEKMQEQRKSKREGWDDKTELTYTTQIFGYEIKDDNNEK